MDEIERINVNLKRLFDKQNELILKINQIIERMNIIPKDIDNQKVHLEKRVDYFEHEINRLKSQTKLSDEDI